MDESILREAGHRLYVTSRLKEMKRYLVFRARCRMHKEIMEDFLAFFAETPLRKEILKGTPAFIEQVTRAFFYKDSSYEERSALIKTHVRYMEKLFTQEALTQLYIDVNTKENCGQLVPVWEDIFEDKPLCLSLYFHAGQYKEGCLSLILTWDGAPFYQIMFWFGPDMEKTGDAIWIGALQGTPHGSDAIKRMTKAFFGYRPKNLIFYGLRNLARCLGISKIYGVTNAGYYAMNHIRLDRKLKTYFGAFWEECEGKPCETDYRFYEMPVKEYRKDMSELKPSKRAQHRRRFEKLDSIDAAFDASCKKLLKKDFTS